MCPHAGSLKRAARRSGDDVQLVGELGGGAEQSSSILHDPDFSAATHRSPRGHRVLLKTERERVSNHKQGLPGFLAMDLDSALRLPPRNREAILWESIRSFLDFPPWMAFISRACQGGAHQESLYTKG